MRYLITIYMADHNIVLDSAHDERLEKMERHLFSTLATTVNGLKQLEVSVTPLLPPTKPEATDDST